MGGSGLGRIDLQSERVSIPVGVQGKAMNHQEHILIVDDDVHTAEYIAELLQAQGYETGWAFDGEEALRALRSVPAQAAGVERAYDLMILDLMIPGIDGYEVCRRVKNDEALRHLSVIMVTGLASTPNKTKGLALGADDYITKPFTPEELLARVNAALRMRTMEREAVQRNRELNALNTISRLTSRSLDLDEVLSTTLGQTLSLMAGRAALIALIEDGDEPQVVLRMHRGLPSQVNGRMTRACWRLGEGVLGQVARSGETLVMTIPSGDPYLALLAEHDMNAVVCTPLIAQRGIVGALAVLHRDDTLWGEHSLRLLEAVSRQVGVTIENAQLYTSVSNYAEELAHSQAQLVQAEKLAAMGRLTASIAHELNNPLQAVQNCLHLILHRPLDVRKREQYLQMAQGEVERLISTVRRMLDFYRPSSAQHRATDLHAVIEDVLELTSKRQQRGKVLVRRRYASSLPTLHVIQDQIKQVILNLVINAIEAMPNGGELRISTALSGDGEWISIAFQDQGVGISKKAKEHLFEPFYTTKTKGTGLGLSVSYGIIEQHGGTIEVDSVEGTGTCFTVRLPVEMLSVHEYEGESTPASGTGAWR
jgi:signal transduction histidine kinase/DNA-binding response OmpR family regulator